MQTPEYLRSLAAVQDSHRILQTISNADFIEKKQQRKLKIALKKKKKVQTQETDNNEQNEQEVHLSTDERIILGKKRKRAAKPEEAEIDLHKFFTQNKRFEPDQASKSSSFVAELREKDYSKDEVLNLISNFLTNSTQGQSVQVQIK